jgi:hypothetical protein
LAPATGSLLRVKCEVQCMKSGTRLPLDMSFTAITTSPPHLVAGHNAYNKHHKSHTSSTTAQDTVLHTFPKNLSAPAMVLSSDTC